MDKRSKILVVEDEDSARRTLTAVLKREGARVESCGSLSEACSAIEAIRFDLALIDIMLAGPQDRANRDGIEVLRRINEAAEGTRTLVLSGQSDIDLVVDIWQEHGADGYVSKETAEREGLPFLLDKIREALKASAAPRQQRDWNSLMHALAPGGADLSLVHDILQQSTFRGGLPVLRDGLLAACKWLVPLLPPGEGQALAADKDLPGAFAGLYWSRGQGCAVQIIVHGVNVDAAAADRHFSAEVHGQMHWRTKSGLTILVLARSDLSRSSFAGS
jgi:CheY-like chemotaxis protein